MSHATLTGLPQWQALQRHFRDIGGKHLRELFGADPKRGEALAVEAVGLYLDYSKQRVDADTLRLLCELAGACQLPQRIEAMFSGRRIPENAATVEVAGRPVQGTSSEAGWTVQFVPHVMPSTNPDDTGSAPTKKKKPAR